MHATAMQEGGQARGLTLWRLYTLLRQLALIVGGDKGRSPVTALTHSAHWYIRTIIGLGTGLTIACLLSGSAAISAALPLILALGAIAGVAEFFRIRLRYCTSITVSVVAYGVAFILLSPLAAVCVPAVAGLVHLAHGLRTRTLNLRRLLFNAAQLAITVFFAAFTFDLLAESPTGPFSSLSDFLALVAAGLVYFFVNTSLVAVASALTRRLSPVFVWRANYAGLGHYFVGLLSVASILAVLWHERPLMLPLAAGLAVLMHRALNVPNLIEEARTDSKTGLYNVQHFYKVFEQELRRAERFGRPLSIVMADLDHLRDVNNAYGHLAGDAVIRGTAEVIRAATRDYDLAARFGGEEFALLLLETSHVEAEDVAERIRLRLAETAFKVPTSQAPIRVTVSLGVASFPNDGNDVDTLLHHADQRMYLAKGSGRNCVGGVAGVGGCHVPCDDESPAAVR